MSIFNICSFILLIIISSVSDSPSKLLIFSLIILKPTLIINIATIIVATTSAYFKNSILLLNCIKIADNNTTIELKTSALLSLPLEITIVLFKILNVYTLR